MFDIGAKFDDDWQSDNKKRTRQPTSSESLPPERHRLRINRERRRGKWVTLCGPFSLNSAQCKALLKAIKKELGTGGTWKEEVLEIQGDRSDALKKALKSRDFRFR